MVELDKNKRTFWEFFIRNYKFTFLIVLSAVLFGFLAIVQMPKESQPEVEIPIGVVVSVFPGASVTDVEELVTNVIEDKISSLDNVDSLSSVSRRGLSSITVEFDPDADTDKMIDELKDAVDEVTIDLPADVEDPVVQKVSLDDTPFLTLAMSGPFDLPQLKLYAEDVKDEIERVQGVSTVQLFGGQERQFEVIVNKSNLNTFGLGLLQVTQAIERANSDVPIGSIITAEEEFNIRFDGRIASKEDIESIPITSVDGTPVFIRNVATVIDGFTEPDKLVRLSTNGNPSEQAVTLRVFKTSGGDVTRIARTILERVEAMEQNELPQSVSIIPIEDLAKYVQQDLTSLSRNGIATVIIVTLLLALFLGWREAFLAAISIPLSFLFTFIILFYAGFSINFMTLFSLILSLGILVDSTIVINESLNKQMKTATSPAEAARLSILELQYPLIAGTLTTVFAFVPMLLTSGIIGEYIKTIPVTVTAVLVSSLFVALGIITTLSVVLTCRSQDKAKQKPPKAKKAKYFTGLFDRARAWYGGYIRSLLQDKPARTRIKRYLFIAFIFAYALPFVGVLPAELFPADDQDSFLIDYEKAFGTTLSDTMADMQEIEKQLYEDDRIASFVVNAGFGGSLGSAAGGGEGSHLGYILVNLKEEGRKEKSFEMVDEYQDIITIPGDGKVTVTQISTGPGTGAPVQVSIKGPDLVVLDGLANDIKEEIEKIPGTQNVDTSIIQTNGQFVVTVNRGKASQYGVSTSDVALTLRNAVTGLDATQIQQDGEDIDVLVRAGLSQAAFAPDANRRITDINTIGALSIATPRGEIPLSSVVDINLENSRASIQHEEGERVVKVSSYLSSDASAGAVFGEVGKVLEGMTLPDGYSVSTGGEDEDTAQSLNDMFRAMILAVILIAALLVLQFKSFKQSIIILLTIPLALIGVFPGLVLVGLPLSFPGMIGIVALAGIVVNNAIILIDKINTNIALGETLDEAIANAGAARLEPIVLTTITTVCGILPLALTEPVWSSLGFSIIFGLLFSTVLTLLVIPLLYKKMHRKKFVQKTV